MLRETRRSPREAGEGGRTDGAEELLAAGGHAVKCYLESHLAHKDGGEDVVGDGEEDSFLETQSERGEDDDQMKFVKLAQPNGGDGTRLPSCPAGSWASPEPR